MQKIAMLIRECDLVRSWQFYKTRYIELQIDLMRHALMGSVTSKAQGNLEAINYNVRMANYI